MYDSALRKDDDFGPGWKLTLREEITRSGDRLAFTDASNSTYALEIDASAVKPVHPASTPVWSGEILEGGDAIVLRSLDLTRRFEDMRGVYRLVEARNRYGSVRLTYRDDGRIESAASKTARLRFERRADGRVTAVRDEHGRSVVYKYNSRDRLARARDLAGARWRYRYADGRITSMEDPRGKVILHAVYDAAGRVSWIEVQGEKSAFAYRGTTTRAVDGIGRITVFHRAKSGATAGVESPLGTFSQLAFDAAGRPAQVLRDGGEVASLGYSAEGRLASLRRPAGETRFAHGARGLSRVVGAETAKYGYDRAGRLVAATDAGGVRGYDYDAGGFPSRIEIDDWKTAVRHNAQGQTTRVARSGRTLVEYVYQPDGRVASIKHSGEPGTTADYRYDMRGLRATASYSSGADSTMAYDATGNLIRYVLESPHAKHSQEYELGDHNEVLRIRNGGDEAGPDVVFRYFRRRSTFGSAADARSTARFGRPAHGCTRCGTETARRRTRSVPSGSRLPAAMSTEAPASTTWWTSSTAHSVSRCWRSAEASAGRSWPIPRTTATASS